MGNLAMKCENEWQSRSTNLMRRAADVRVMRADSTEVEEFDRPVVAAEVMYQFPDYVVVRWCPSINTKLGKRGQLRVLQGHDVLSPGQIYFLFPIPIEVIKNNNVSRNNLRRCRHMQSAKNRLAQLLSKRSDMGPDGSMHSNERSIIPEDGTTTKADLRDTQSNDCPGFKTSGEYKLSSENLQSLQLSATAVAVAATDEKGGSGTQSGNGPNSDGISRNWRPALVSIPESPVGFHSRSESPMTPIAFRLVSLKDGESFEEGSSSVLL